MQLKNIYNEPPKNNSMKTLITLTAILTLIFSGLLISGLNNYNNACEAAANCEGSDIAIETELYKHGFNISCFDEPTTVDYIKSNFK